MNHSLVKRLSASLCVLAAIGIGGCANNQPLYAWGSYQPQVHEHLKAEGKGPEEQLLEMEKGIQTAAAKGAKLPPGYHAHLGLLYLKTGRTDQAVASWNQEKAQFPESTKYIDFLLNNMKKNGG